MYKLIFDDRLKQIADGIILKTDGGITIPFDPANTDYQEYLKWLAEGNEPEPADEV